MFRPTPVSASDRQSGLAQLHSRGDVVLFNQVRHIILLAACRANRDHLPREREELCGAGSGFLITQRALCKREMGSQTTTMSSCGTKF